MEKTKLHASYVFLKPEEVEEGFDLGMPFPKFPQFYHDIDGDGVCEYGRFVKYRPDSWKKGDPLQYQLSFARRDRRKGKFTLKLQYSYDSRPGIDSGWSELPRYLELNDNGRVNYFRYVGGPGAEGGVYLAMLRGDKMSFSWDTVRGLDVEKPPDKQVNKEWKRLQKDAVVCPTPPTCPKPEARNIYTVSSLAGNRTKLEPVINVVPDPNFGASYAKISVEITIEGSSRLEQIILKGRDSLSGNYNFSKNEIESTRGQLDICPGNYLLTVDGTTGGSDGLIKAVVSHYTLESKLWPTPIVNSVAMLKPKILVGPGPRGKKPVREKKA